MERNEMKYLMLILLVVCVFAARTTPSSAQNNQVKNVLVLNSYHKGFAWSDGIMEGIWSEFKRSGQNIKLDIEYMDTKRISDQKHYQNLYELYKHKFSKRDYDLILTSDDNAFSFILKYHDELFLEKPVVFCGLNSLDKSLEADLLRLGWITGSVEMYDIRGNLDLILNLHPDVKQIVVISDNTVSSKKCKAKVQEAAHQMPDSIRFNYLEEDAYMEDILAQVRGLPLDSVVFLMSFFKDREGKYYTPQAGGKMISKNSPVPVYSAWDFYLGHGITGGLTTSSNAQGEMGAKIALRVLNGEKISDIPVSREPANYYMFDYKEMERFGIKLSNLPKDSIVINKPYSFYTEYKGLILTALGAFVCLILIILVLIRNIFRRRQSEKLFRKLFERSPVGLFIVQDGKFQLLNSQFLRLTGYNEEDFLGKEPLTFILPEDRNMVNENTIKMLKEGLSFPFEFRVINKNGETRWVELTITSIQYQQKRAILGYCIDITERKQAQQEIIKRQKYLESVVYSAPDAIMTLDASRNIIEWNPGAKRIFGYTRDEVVGKDIDDLISRPDVKHELKGFTKRLLSREIVLPFKAVRYRKDGTPVNVIVAGSPILIDGKLHGVVAVYTDITEEKKLEAQLHQAQKIEAIGTLAGGIAHDFNNILAAIIGYAELVKMKLPEDSEFLPNLDQILKSGDRAKTLIQRILAFSRKQELEQKPLQLKYIVKESLKLLRATLPTDIEIKEDIAKDVGVVNADHTQMQQVIMNLCTNAGHAMQEEGGVLAVGLDNVELDDIAAAQYLDIDAGTYLRLSVSDTGYGMTPDVKERIFEPYFTTKEKGVGTGLGLSVVHGIVKNHNGEITVYSEPGKGSTFHVYLPLIQEEAIKPEIDEQVLIPTGNERILFIDDEPTLVEIGTQMLERLGYKVTARTSSIEALELFKAKPDQFDLVITDMTMPNMTGDKLAQELMKVRPDIPIVICTGFSERISEEKASSLGIRKFVMKPIVMSDMAKTVRRCLD